MRVTRELTHSYQTHLSILPFSRTSWKSRKSSSRPSFPRIARARMASQSWTNPWWTSSNPTRAPLKWSSCPSLSSSHSAWPNHHSKGRATPASLRADHHLPLASSIQLMEGLRGRSMHRVRIVPLVLSIIYQRRLPIMQRPCRAVWIALRCDMVVHNNRDELPIRPTHTRHRCFRVGSVRATSTARPWTPPTRSPRMGGAPSTTRMWT